MHKKISPQKLTNITLMLVLALGLAAGVYGGYVYWDARQHIEDNYFRQAKESGKPIEPYPWKATELRNSELELYRYQDQQAMSAKLIGVGLALIAVAWIGRDFIAGRRKHTQLDDPQQAPSSSG